MNAVELAQKILAPGNDLAYNLRERQLARALLAADKGLENYAAYPDGWYVGPDGSRYQHMSLEASKTLAEIRGEQ